MSERADLKADGPSRDPSLAGPTRPDPRSRPADPAGTRPKIDPNSLEPVQERDAIATPTAHVHPDTRDPAHGLAPTQVSTHTPIPHAPRFQFMFGALGAVGVAVIAAAILIATRPAAPPSVPWSSWRPTSGNGDPALQIAEHVEPEYALSATQPLVAISGGPPAIAGQPVVVALHTSGSTPELLPENGIFYQLCGAGSNCSIPGKPSYERALLVRREALELALYTLRYVKDVSQVVVSYPPLPPSAGAHATKTSRLEHSGAIVNPSTGHPPSRVLLFRPDSLRGELSRPLQYTLSEDTPTLKTISKAPEAVLVNRLTGNVLYDSLLSEQQSGLVLLLEQPSIGG